MERDISGFGGGEIGEKKGKEREGEFTNEMNGDGRSHHGGTGLTSKLGEREVGEGKEEGEGGVMGELGRGG